MTMYLRRRAAFSAGFQHAAPGIAGRGHDYCVELTVGGEIDPNTGMVVNIKDVDAVLKAQVVALLGGRLLDAEVAAFQDIPPTPENIVCWIWERCCPALPAAGRLSRVTLWPSPTLRAELAHVPATEETLMLTVTRTYDFSASHRLHSQLLSDDENAAIFGKCNWANGHGHNYEIEVTLAGEPDRRTGQLWEGQRLDEIVEDVVLKPYDHKHLNCDTDDFRSLNPTSENLTKVIWNNISRRMRGEDSGGARLYRVAVKETARNYFEYFGE